MVAPHTDSDNRIGGVQRNSRAGADAAVRGFGLAARRADARFGQTLCVCVLASGDHSDFVVGAGPRNCGDEHDRVRRAVDAQSHWVARLRYSAGKFVARRIARACSDGEAAGRRARLRVHDRWATRAEIYREAGAGDAGAEDRMPGGGVSHRGRPRKDVWEDVGSFSFAETVCPGGDFVCAADFRSGRRYGGWARSQTRRDAESAGTSSRYCRVVVCALRRSPCRPPGGVFEIGSTPYPPVFPKSAQVFLIQWLANSTENGSAQVEWLQWVARRVISKRLSQRYTM